jgi:hypothetical protein
MAKLTDAERTLYRQRLVKAEKAYDEILTGKAVKRFVDQNGETVEYATANISKLADYIESLKQLLDCGRARAMRSRPLRFLF